MTLDYDFWINGVGAGLGFNLAIDKDHPYQRATAQFRKEQFDSQATVGDQSLTGWWTRGQLSFHKGAGINYYEVLEGDTVLNRFSDADSLEVFEPGQVTLLPAMGDLSLAVADAVPAPLSAGGGVYALTDTGVVYTAGSGSTAVDTSDSVVPTSITSSGTLYYVANGTKIERQFAPSEARTNHVTNPSFEADTSGLAGAIDWVYDGVSGEMSGHPARAKYGAQSLFCNGDPTFGTGCHTPLSGLTIGVTYIVSGWVWLQGYGGSPETTNYGVALVIDGAGAPVVMGSTTAFGSWVRLSGTWVADATSADLKATTGSLGGGSGPYHPDFFLDSVMVTEYPYTNDYFDGSYPGCSWAGTPNQSKSSFATSTNGDSTVLVTLSGGATWKKVWWAKGRLWAVDSDGYWYALAAVVATVTNADAFWNSASTDTPWSLSDGPGPVYISNGHDIYAVTVGTDGLVPTLGAPTTAARVPLGEDISTISYYLGYLVIATSRGIRTALVQADGSVLVGPLVVEGDFSSASRVGVYDTLAHVVGRPDGRSGANVLCVLDLSVTVGDLAFAWTPLVTVSELASTTSGAVADATGRIYTWAGGESFAASRDELAASGYLKTGFHRFGTLDSKAFARLSVRLKGTGQVEVFRIAEDDTATTIGTLDAADGVGEIALDGTAAERIALKFVLSRDTTDSTKGPTLLGYQLKALPLPKRQRMIRVPLLLRDRETNRSGQQIVQDPWDRVAALEALEASNAVVTFSDGETGETGNAYIEAVEVERTNPPARGPGGFGGYIYLTLRKL